MNTNNLRKDELQSIIDEQSNVIENLKADLRKEGDFKRNAEHEIVSLEEKIKQIKKDQAYLHHQNIADMKSLQNFLLIFSNEHMTHNEKAYLSRKINQTVDMLIQDRINSLEKFYQTINNGKDLPF